MVRFTKTPVVIVFALLGAVALAATIPVHAYPPGVGIIAKNRDCVAAKCHVNNGPWKDDSKTIIDILDKDTEQSLKQSDGTFLISAKRGQARTVLTIIGRTKDATAPIPYRNAWLYIDPSRIESDSLSKFAPGWAVNLSMSCRVVGDELKAFEHANITVLPMTLRPLEDATDAELELQVMLTRGESVKGKAQEGMLGSYFVRNVRLKVIE